MELTDGLGIDCGDVWNCNCGSATSLACSTVMLPFIMMVRMRGGTDWGGGGRDQEFRLVYVRTEMSGRHSPGNAKVRGGGNL